jgi:DNA-directed RNA polymerase specialized sigma24 family protein
MTISSSIAPHLPYLRRFARAVSGNQTSGDAYALATLEAIVADTQTLRKDLEPRVALYQVFLRVWGSVAFGAEDRSGGES